MNSEEKRAYQKKHYAENKDYYKRRNNAAELALRSEVNKFKEERACADCGSFFPYYVMQFDHVRGKKVAHVATLVMNNARFKVWEEIKKCDVVCANCHCVRTHKRLRVAQKDRAGLS